MCQAMGDQRTFQCNNGTTCVNCLFHLFGHLEKHFMLLRSREWGGRMSTEVGRTGQWIGHNQGKKTTGKMGKLGQEGNGGAQSRVVHPSFFVFSFVLLEMILPAIQIFFKSDDISS
jgi:hypothetical protein